MSYNRVTIISIIVTAIFAMPLFSFAEDGNVHGVPFQVLQDQIDDLQQQINDLQQGSMCAAYSAHAYGMEIIEDPTIVMSIDLPAGDYVSNISLGLQYQAESHGFWAECWAYFGCQTRDAATSDPIPGIGIGANVVGIMTHSNTGLLELAEPTNVAFECSLETVWCPGYPDTPLNLMSANWTLIKVDHK